MNGEAGEVGGVGGVGGFEDRLRAAGRVGRYAGAAAVLVLSFIPLAEWIGLPRRELRPPWGSTAGFWIWGTALVLGLGVVAQILTRHRVAGWLDRAWERYAAPRDRWVALAIGLWVFGWGAVIADLLFSRNPNLVDSVVQLFHAKIFASGLLAAPRPSVPEFFLTQHMIVTPDKFFSQFPPGHPAVMGVALRLGFPSWLVSPLLAAGAGVFTYAAIARSLGAGIGRLAALLLVSSPFFIFMAGEQMNHVTALFFLSAGFYALVRGREGAGTPSFVACGLALGLAFATRPLDAVAWALPLGALLLWERRWRGLAAVVAGGLPVTALVLAYNAVTTGDPLLFGYVYLWGDTHSVGFHRDPWGDPYTPVAALGFLNLDLRRLSLYAFEWPLPLAPVLAAALLWWPRGIDRAAAALVATAAAVVGANFFYWHHGLYLGPRMLYTGIPGLVALTAIGLRSLDGAAGRWRGAYRCAVLAAVALAFTQTIPARAQNRAERYFSMKLHPDRQAWEAGVHNAVIFVAESWASRMLARLWAWGVPPPEVERSYRTIDSCEIDEVLREAERRAALGADRSDVLAWLRRELALRRERNGHVELPKADTLPDHTLKLAPGRPITRRCRALIEQDYEGFSLFTPFLPLNAPTLDGDLVFARDLRERDTLLMREYPGRSYYLYTPRTPVQGIVPQLVPLELPAGAEPAR